MFAKYMSKYRCEKGQPFTHTSISKPRASYYVSVDDQHEFFAKYKDAFLANESLYMTEKHNEQGPIVLDFDFRFDDINDTSRRYTPEHILDLINTYISIVKSIIQVDNDTEVFVLEKPFPRIEKGKLKDGIHIIIPSLVTTPSAQKYFREKSLPLIGQILSDIGTTNSTAECFDIAVIDKNNWQMYGSTKPDQPPYKVTKVYIVENGEVVEADSTYTEIEFVELLSIRNKYVLTPFVDDKVKQDILEYTAIQMKSMKPKVIEQLMFHSDNSSYEVVKNQARDINLAAKLVDLLSLERANSYEDWIRLGWCLRNIDYRLLPNWVEFSKKSPKYEQDECDSLWDKMKVNGGLGIGTLKMWASKDNPEAYKEIVREDVFNLINKAQTSTHYDVACVVFAMYGGDFICASPKNRTWYEFSGHRWHICEEGINLSQKISVQVCQEFSYVASIFNQKAALAEDDAQQKQYLETSSKLNKTALLLKNTSFKSSVMKECMAMFHVPRFEEKLDSRCHLIGFENGVFDLETMTFRDGTPEDFISFSTGIKYQPFDEQSTEIKQLVSYFEQVLPKNDVREYVLLHLASCLNGNIREERFHIWTGSGCHTYNTDIMMYDGVFKKVQDIVIGDKLMGDDSTPRNVLKLYRGEGEMFEVIPYKGKSFIVNGDHVLSLKLLNTRRIEYFNNKWYVSWYEYDFDNILKKYTIEFYVEKEAISFDNTLKSNCNIVKNEDVIDITLYQYLKLLNMYGKQIFYIYRPQLVVFKEQDIPFDAYDVGISLSDYHTCIPNVYMYNSKNIRLCVLAGIIDAYGTYNIKTKSIEIFLELDSLLDDIIFIGRSLGFECYKAKNYIVTIQGPLSNIPSKKLHIQDMFESYNYAIQFDIVLTGKDCYYGFELDKNHRYLDKEFIVMHNSNSKSKLIDLFEKSFGDYCCKLPVSLLTNKRAQSNAATSEIARTKGRRFAVLQEPSENEKFNVGLMKELTGGDKIQARGLYKEPVEFRPQFKMILTCNHLPEVPADDDGTWRRIRLVEFISKFCANPTPLNPYEFPIDTDLSTKMEHWKEAFMGLLLNYYEKYKLSGMAEPDEIMKCTKEYQRNNDFISDFLDACATPVENIFASITEMYAIFKAWHKDNNPEARLPSRKEFGKMVTKVWGILSRGRGGAQGWYGYKISYDPYNEGNDIIDI
jgi:P4 family phage/plasmid primase-like protien